MSDEQSAIIELGVNMTQKFDEFNQPLKQLENVLISDLVTAQYMEVFSNVFSIKSYI
jgi:hypothetical protein